MVERWVENPYWQYFCGYEQLQHKLPLHPTTLVKCLIKFRNLGLPRVRFVRQILSISGSPQYTFPYLYGDRCLQGYLQRQHSSQHNYQNHVGIARHFLKLVIIVFIVNFYVFCINLIYFRYRQIISLYIAFYETSKQYSQDV